MEDHAVRSMRREEREIDEIEARKILEKGEYGVLSTVGADGEPYGVPLNFVYREGEIHLHAALDGRKLENLKHLNHASFCVVGSTQLQPEMFSTRYECAIASGEVRELFGEEKLRSLLWLVQKYSPDFQAEGAKYIASREELTRVFALHVAHLTGKRRA
jgi:nitroimidazol reductase NimA-like FMN-containing flavoprotein (pyridoxamine 5'-phosphate oxidase superfamily)